MQRVVRVRPPSWIFKSWKFLLLVRFGGRMCISSSITIANFAQSGQTILEIWPFSNFSKWQPSATLDFLKLEILTAHTLRRAANMRQPSQFLRRSAKPLPIYDCRVAVDGSVLYWYCYYGLFRATVKYDFWHDFAGKGVLNVLGGVLPE